MSEDQELKNPLDNYKYIGQNQINLGETALGIWRGGQFFVQVEQFDHPHSHGWWHANSDDWELR
jgi:hypothetical protein